MRMVLAWLRQGIDGRNRITRGFAGGRPRRSARAFRVEGAEGQVTGGGTGRWAALCHLTITRGGSLVKSAWTWRALPPSRSTRAEREPSQVGLSKVAWYSP